MTLGISDSWQLGRVDDVLARAATPEPGEKGSDRQPAMKAGKLGGLGNGFRRKSP